MNNLDAFVGLPYKDKGRDYDGTDCWGLLYLVYRDVLGIHLPTYTGDYQTATDYKEIARIIDGGKLLWRKIDAPEKPKMFDGVLLRYGRHQSHVGIFLRHSSFLHVQEHGHSVVSNLKSPEWRDRVVGFYKFEKENAATH